MMSLRNPLGNSREPENEGNPSVQNAFASAVSPSPFTQPIRLIPIERVGDILGLKKSAIQELAAQGVLPQKIKLGTSRRSAARWVEAEIYAFAWSLATQRPMQPTTAASTCSTRKAAKAVA